MAGFLSATVAVRSAADAGGLIDVYISGLCRGKKDEMDEVKQNTIIELGLGKVSIDRGTCGGVASVFIEPLSVAGTPGEKGPLLPLNSVQPGTIIIRINDQCGADVLAEKLAPRMRDALVKLDEWFETLQGTGPNDPLWTLLKRANETPRKIIADALQPIRTQENGAKVVREIEDAQCRRY